MALGIWVLGLVTVFLDWVWGLEFKILGLGFGSGIGDWELEWVIWVRKWNLRFSIFLVFAKNEVLEGLLGITLPYNQIIMLALCIIVIAVQLIGSQ